MSQDTFGDRMKRFETVSQSKLMRRTPVIIRLDGKAFHTFTKGCTRPFDFVLHDALSRTTQTLCNSIQGAVFAYRQSDEISILLKDWTTFETDAWFDGNIQKIVSVAASICTASFAAEFQHLSGKTALFDARVFNIPFEEVTNYFLWRQQDATRNSINSLAQSHFSHKQLQGKNVSQVQDMLMLQKGVNWNDVPTKFKRGVCVDANACGFHIDNEPPIFSQDREYIEKYLIRE